MASLAGGPSLERSLESYLAEEIGAVLDSAQRRQRGEEGVLEIAREAAAFAARRREGEVLLRVCDGAGSRRDRSIVYALLRDQPFLVDTLRLNLRRLGQREALLLHPLLAVERDAAGAAARFGRGQTEARESLLYVELPALADDAARESLAAELRRVLCQAADAVADHPRMVGALRAHAAEVERSARRGAEEGAGGRELAAFLDWLAQDNFIFLGYRRYVATAAGGEAAIEVERGSGLGLLRDASRSRFRERLAGDAIPPMVRSRLGDPRLVYFDKSKTESTIHRSGRLDSITVKTLDEQGRVTGFGRFVGLLTFKAVRTRGSQIPTLRERLRQVLAKLDLEPNSHTWKAAIEAYDSLPVEFLFPFDTGDLITAVQRILRASEQLGVEVLVVPDPLERAFFASVILPRASYEEGLVAEVEALLRERHGVTYVDHRSSFVDDAIALIHFFCSGAQNVTPERLAALERELRSRAASWEERLSQALLERLPAEQARRLGDLAPALPEEYRLSTDPAESVHDLACLERLRARECDVDVALWASPAGSGQPPRLKIYQRARPYLTDLVPVLDDFGLRAIDASVIEVRGAGSEPLWLARLRVEDPDPAGCGLEPGLLDGLRAVLAGQVEHDALNRLILGAHLEWRQVDVLRAYLALAGQLGTAPDRRFAARSFERHPAATRALLALFRARFAPGARAERDGERAEAERAARESLARARERIPTADEDRVFALVASFIGATVRTSFFSAPAPGPHEIAFKLDGGRLEGAPEPRTQFESFVHSIDLVGVHLRRGPVARGGIRWSDRREDVRREVHGLMKTQSLKNGLIVPLGAKGGFALRRRPEDPAAARAEADRQYTRFVRALLRLADNVVDGRVVPPRRLVRHDGDDPYLVVAADKGTAHLSDTANAVAREEGFWLGDAFASGGSNGYDHKKEAITARGAWACVRRHALELGLDLDGAPFRMAGIGDMSGDVFGNGLLQSRKARLLAAFDHRHVFVDPDPDPEASWRERRRLFEQPGSSWKDYEPGALSRGGGVWERSARALDLSPEARALLGLESERPSGEEAVRAILRLRVDVLWNGGIGTYVKASDESNADVGDRANAGVRIDARELGAKIVAEGGNNGFTQRARVEYALAGGRIDTDAIDNSGGVDLSDHEVNFKILLAAPLAAGRISPDERSALLRSCVEPACSAVLAHNASQSRCLSLDLLRAQLDPERSVEAAAYLARHAGLSWRQEELPERDELRERAARPGHAGYTRPELAVLLGWTKLHAKRMLAASDLVEHPSLRLVRDAYFPELLRERFGDAIEAHPLRREITATALTNRVIDCAGVTLVPALAQSTGAGAAEAIAAWYVADRVLETEHLRWAVAEQKLPEATRLRAALWIEDALRDAARARLGLERRALLEPEEIANWIGVVRSLREILHDCLDATTRERAARAADAFASQGIAPAVAFELARLPALVRLLGIVPVVLRSGASLPRAAAVHAEVGRRCGVAWLLERLAAAPAREGWDRVAAESIWLDCVEVERRLCERMLAADGVGVRDVDAFCADHASALRRIEQTILDIESDDRGGVAALAVLAALIRRLL